jgi:predicted PurR-regulated permease PerM
VLVVGLFLIGIPNAILWAVLALVLRFVLYVGIWISAFYSATPPLIRGIPKACIKTWREYGGKYVLCD